MAEEARDADLELKPGDLFDGRFQLVKPLGTGNFSSVYEARQTVWGTYLRTVALKVFKGGRVTTENMREKFHDAIEVFQLIEEHPDPEIERHIVRVHDGGVASKPKGEGCAYLTMEVVGGGELHDAIARHSGLPGCRGVSVDMSLLFMKQILIPLAWMHSLDPPEVHADLHPGNVLVTEEVGGRGGELKLADFGLAVRLPLPVLGGAIQYQSPETLMGTPGNTQSDVYGLGIMWYEMLTRRTPFEADDLKRLQFELNALEAEAKALGRAKREDEKKRKDEECDRKRAEYVQAHLEARRRPIPPASEDNEELGKHLALEDILNRCLAYLPEKRFWNAVQVKKAIEDWERGQSGTAGLSSRVLRAPDTAGQASRATLPPKETSAPRVLSPDMILDQAERLAQRGQCDAALLEADKVLTRDKRCVKAWLVKARIALAVANTQPARHGEWVKLAGQFVQGADEVAPGDPAVLRTLAAVYRADGKPGVAEAIEKEAADREKQAARRRHG